LRHISTPYQKKAILSGKPPNSSKKPITHVSPILQEDGNWRKTEKENVTAFAEYLSKVFTTPQTNNNNNNFENIVQTSLGSACPVTRTIKPLSPSDVKKEIKKCGNHQAPGFDLITGQILKELPSRAVPLLTTIYNSMLRITYFPILWKFAQIIMNHKPGKPPNRVTSYRPISLLPIMSKIFERILVKIIQMDEDTSTKIPTHQFGFRENHSTEQQFHRIVNEILKSLEEKKLCTVAFPDIQQAFDRVRHDSLLYKLKATFPTPYYLLLKSYLTDRYSQIKYNTKTSDNFPIHSGVPQGPLLYLIFTADIPTRKDTVIATFTDDTAIMASNENPQMHPSAFKLTLINSKPG
jgi:hypothetical protein